LPSTAAEAGVPAFSTEEAVAGLFSAAFTPPQRPVVSKEPYTANSNRE
jgi:hypothetical protein